MGRSHRDFQHALADAAGRLVETLAEQQGDNLVSAVLFGSVARGEAVRGSDVDLLLVLRDLPHARVDRHRVFYDARLAQAGFLRALYEQGIAFDWSPLLLTTEEARQRSPLYLDLVDDARLLLDRGGFFTAVLDDMRLRMAELGSRRVELRNGSWLWLLAPDRAPGEAVEL